jgi:hypothetical protein
MAETKHYFKIDRRIVDISHLALSEKALKVYILHCRRINPRKNLGCSMAGATDAKKYAGIPDKAVYNAAIKELCSKHLIEMRHDIKTGYLKATAIEILTFPVYDAKNRRFKPVTGLEHNHRTYSPGQYIRIPSAIVDDGMLKKLNAETLLTMLRLFSKTDMKTFGGVDPRYIHCYCSDTPAGYKPFKSEPHLSEALEAKRYRFTANINCQAVNDLVHHSLFKYCKVLAYRDKSDPDYMYIIEFLKQSDNGKYIISTPKSDGQIVIDILVPQFSADNFFIDSS